MLELVNLRFMPYFKVESFFSTFHTLYTKNQHEILSEHHGQMWHRGE